MKRILLILLSVALLAALLIIPAMATTGGSAAVSGATGASGETVKVTLSLKDFAQADAISVRVTADQGLTWSEDPGQWLVNGALDNINTDRNLAVWGTDIDTLADVNTDVLELAFVLPEPAAGQTDFTYEVKCAVTVMAKGEVLKDVEATGTVTLLNKAASVTLNNSAVTLDLNGTTTQTLTATVLPANCTQSAQWSSDNAEVAAVENGVVTAKKAGTAKITVTVGNVSASCTVTVTCSHKWTEHTAVTPNCQRTGNNQYFTCDICELIVKADKTTVTTIEAETLEKTGHAGGTATCTKKAVCDTCGQEYGELKAHDYDAAWINDANNHWHKCKNCTATTTAEAHSFTWVLDKAATEDETGLKHEECVCGVKRSEGTEIPKLDHVHVGITHHAAVKATCVKAGTVEYWTCSSSKCTGKFYGDANCQLELTTNVEPINKNNHVGGTELKNAAEPTCSEEGYTGDTHCVSCNEITKQGSVIPATGKHTPKAGYLTDDAQHWQICSHCSAVVESTKAAHSYKWVVDQSASETATGLKHEACVCGVKRSEGTVIEKLKHAPKLVEGKAPTCTEAGTLEHFYCANCGSYYASANGKAGDKISKDSITLAAIGHSFSAEWQSDAKGHFHVCACGEVADQAAHTTEVVNAKDATETETGYTGDTVCTVCQYVVSQGQEIPVVVTEPTTEPSTEATEPADGGDKDNEGGISPVIWIVPAVIAAAAAIIVPLWKKRKA